MTTHQLGVHSMKLPRVFWCTKKPHGNFVVKTGGDYSTQFWCSMCDVCIHCLPPVFFPFSISSVFGSTLGTWRVLKCRCCIFHFSPQETRRTIACYVRTVGSSRGVNSAPTHLLVGWAENLCFLLASFELSIVTLTPPRVQKKRDDDFLEEKFLISLKLYFAGTIAYRFELHFFDGKSCAMLRPGRHGEGGDDARGAAGGFATTVSAAGGSNLDRKKNWWMAHG